LARRIFTLVKQPEHQRYTYHQEGVLPWSVRFALQHRGAELTGKNIEDLYGNGLPRAAFYLALKAADASPDAQLQMLQRLADKRFNYFSLTASDIRVGTVVLGTEVGAADTVKGEKLGKLSLHGFSGELQAFDKTLTAELAGHPTSPLFMVANSPYIALDVLAKHSLAKGNALGVIKPNHLAQPTDSPGFLIEDTNGKFQVNRLDPDFQLPPDAVIFDDAVRQGTTSDAILEWAGASASSAIFIAASYSTLKI